jgi:hypothetical protein
MSIIRILYLTLSTVRDILKMHNIPETGSSDVGGDGEVGRGSYSGSVGRS